MPIVIRPGRAADIPALRMCVDTVARERRYLIFLQAPPLRTARAFWQGIIKERYPLEIALDGRRVVGWCDIRPLPHEMLRHTGHLGMGVHPDYRGRGIGRRLITAALDKSRRRGLERIELHVFAGNRRARRLYKSVGFRIEGVRRRYRKLDGEYDDDVLMALLFARQQRRL
jgi:RimJ/RimL family protein N-acetyltransferase